MHGHTNVKNSFENLRWTVSISELARPLIKAQLSSTFASGFMNTLEDNRRPRLWSETERELWRKGLLSIWVPLVPLAKPGMDKKTIRIL